MQTFIEYEKGSILDFTNCSRKITLKC